MKVLLNDLPREEREGHDGFASLAQLAAECDVISFHVPLYKEGKYKTMHLADAAFFGSLQRRPVIINTSRGEVIETGALLRALDSGQIADAVIDVWENEPDINLELLGKVFIGTPHIAGYSADGKAIEPPQPATPVITAGSLTEAALQMYDPRRDCEALRQHPELFEQLRGDYPLRRERRAFTLVTPQQYQLF